MKHYRFLNSIFIFSVAIFIVATLGPLPCAHGQMSCGHKLGQMLIVSIPPEASRRAGGVTLFNQNLRGLKTPADILNYTQQLQQGRATPLFISVDQEGGLVQRLNAYRGFSNLPSAQTVGAHGDSSAAYEFGRISAEELGAVGVNLNFSTVVDVNTNPNNPVIGKLGRSYSENPNIVAQMGCENVKGYLNSGVLPVLKHFPGHGDTVNDSHLDFAVVDKTREQMERTELVPYKSILNSCPLGDTSMNMAVMTGHLVLPKAVQGDPSIPASFSKEVVTGWLREQMHYKGLIFSDGLEMKGATKLFPSQENPSIPDRKKMAIQAILAGNDVLLFVNNKPVFKSTDEQDRLIDEVCLEAKNNLELGRRINESAARVLRMKQMKPLVNASQIPQMPNETDFARHRDLLRQLGYDPQATAIRPTDVSSPVTQ